MNLSKGMTYNYENNEQSSLKSGSIHNILDSVKIAPIVSFPFLYFYFTKKIDSIF